MKDVHPLDAIIRIAKDGEKPRHQEVAVRVGREGKVLKGLFSGLTGTRYIVRPDHEVGIGSSALTVHSFEKNQDGELHYRSRVSIPADRVDAAVEALWDHANKPPSQVLDERVNAELKRWWEKHGRSSQLAVMKVLHDKRGDIASTIEGTFLGLGFELKIILELDDWPPPPRKLAPFGFPIRLKDYPDKDLSLRIELQLVASDEIGQLDQRKLVSDADWESLIRTCCQATAREKIRLGDYYNDREELERILRGDLDTALRRHGRKCDWIVLTTAPPPRQETYQDVTFTWRTLSGREVTFTVRVKVAFLPDGEALYTRAGSPELFGWLKTCLEESANKLLFQHDFTYLTPDKAREVQSGIEVELKKLAGAIGVEVQTLVVTSRLPEWIYLEGVTVAVSTQSYETDDPGVPVEFDMTIAGRFKSLEANKELIWPEDRLRETIQAQAVEAAQQLIRGITPLDYLINFFGVALSPKEGTPAPVESMHDRIAGAVKARLKLRLGMDVQEIQVRRVDPDWRAIVDSFEKSKDRAFKLVAQPYDRASGFQEYPIELTLRLATVKPEQLFILSKKSIDVEDVWKMAESWVQQEIDAVSVKTYAKRGIGGDTGIEEVLREALAHKAVKHFSLGIDVIQCRIGESREDRIIRDEAGIKLHTRDAYTELEYARIDQTRSDSLSEFEHVSKMRAIRREQELAAATALGEKKVEAIQSLISADSEEAMKTLERIGPASIGTAGQAPALLDAGQPKQLESHPPMQEERARGNAGEQQDKPGQYE